MCAGESFYIGSDMRGQRTSFQPQSCTGRCLVAATGAGMAIALLWMGSVNAETGSSWAGYGYARQPVMQDTVRQEDEPQPSAETDTLETGNQDSLPALIWGAPRLLVEEAPRGLVKAQKVAADQTMDAVRWLAKRRQLTINDVPYGVTGLPVFYYSTNTGWNYGARIHWVDYQRRPYRYKTTINTLHSTRGRSDSYLRFKVPKISDTGFGVELLFADRQDIRVRYYGRGNQSEIVDAFTDPDSPCFRDENYYYYVLQQPSFTFTLLRHLYGPLRISTAVGLQSTTVRPRGERSYYLDAGTPYGVRDGHAGFVGFRLTWDTRDDETVPKRGVFHRWSYETARNSVLALFFEPIDFHRYTFTDARYYPVTQRLNLAQRTIFEVLSGTVPLYAYGEIGGGIDIKGLGGSDTLRGYDSQRFTDNVRFMTNTELRCHLGSLQMYKQYLEFHAVLFFDTGRVWRNLDDLTLSGLHGSGGAGLRIYWNADFVIRLGVAVSTEQYSTHLRYSNIF